MAGKISFFIVWSALLPNAALANQECVDGVCADEIQVSLLQANYQIKGEKNDGEKEELQCANWCKDDKHKLKGWKHLKPEQGQTDAPKCSWIQCQGCTEWRQNCQATCYQVSTPTYYENEKCRHFTSIAGYYTSNNTFVNAKPAWVKEATDTAMFMYLRWNALSLKWHFDTDTDDEASSVASSPCKRQWESGAKCKMDDPSAASSGKWTKGMCCDTDGTGDSSVSACWDAGDIAISKVACTEAMTVDMYSYTTALLENGEEHVAASHLHRTQ